jgi:hypothetical protein
VEVGVWVYDNAKPSGGFFSGGVGCRSRLKKVVESSRRGIKMKSTQG